MGISASQLKQELGDFNRANNQVIRSMVYQPSVTARYMRVVPSIKGVFPALQAITSHLVQGFQAVWTPMGLTEFRVNELKNYRQKVNFAIRPNDIHGSWLAALYTENKKPQDMPISQYIMNEQLGPKVVADRELLICKGKYDATKLGQFGFSMNGIVELINQGLAVGTDNPVYQVPLVALTSSNITDQVTAFEQGIPEVLKSLLPRIFMSSANLERYRLDYFKKYGSYPSYTEGKGFQTILGGRELVGLPGLNGSDLIFTTPAENFLRLIDLTDEAIINDIQAADYDVKIFMEWAEGVAFHTNQMVVAGVVGGAVSGLGDPALDEKYFPKL